MDLERFRLRRFLESLPPEELQRVDEPARWVTWRRSTTATRRRSGSARRAAPSSPPT